MTKTLNQIIFFSSTKIRIFFQQHWESEYFCLEKKPYPTPWKSLNLSKNMKQENVHIKFCKFSLGVGKRTTRIAVLGELGR
jgi:hypothetical protein